MSSITLYSGKKFIYEAAKAHKSKQISYSPKGVVTLTDPALKSVIGSTTVTIPLEKQFPAVFATFMDLNKSLSNLANSPVIEGKTTLRQDFEEEFSQYRDLFAKPHTNKAWEPDYGNYYFDYVAGNLYLLAPEKWHRLGLVTNIAKLITAPKDDLSWREIREIFDNAVVGFAGISVGGNILEGWMREARPKRIKVADMDWEEVTNLNRLERGSIRYLVASRAHKKDPKNPFEVVRVNKAELAAYEHQLVDPYSQWDIYSSGLTEDSIERFILGNGKNEPKLDVFVEEMDNLPLKVKAREICRKHKIPVLMLSDFGHRALAQFQDFKKKPKLELGYKIPDKKLYALLEKVTSGGGNRADVFAFVEGLCGPYYAADEFKTWIQGEGEQPTSSLPQSGATAQAAGGIGGKILAWYMLGYDIPEMFVIDLKNRQVLT